MDRLINVNTDVRPSGLPVGPGRRSILLALLVLVCVSLGTVPMGCTLIQRDGVVPQSMIESRRFSQQGLTAMERQNWPEAERMLAAAVTTCATDAQAREYYAKALWHAGSRQEAVTQMAEAIRLTPDDAAFKRQMAEYQLALGSPAEASRYIEESLDLDPRSAPTWAVRGQIRQQAGQVHEAIADYQRSLGLEPNQAQVLLRVAELYRSVNQPRRTLAALQTMRETYPPGEEPAQVFYLMGLALAAQDRSEEAIASFELARQRGDQSPELLYQLAVAQYSSGQSGGAEQTAIELLARVPNHAAGHELMQRIRTSQSPRPATRLH